MPFGAGASNSELFKQASPNCSARRCLIAVVAPKRSGATVSRHFPHADSQSLKSDCPNRRQLPAAAPHGVRPCFVDLSQGFCYSSCPLRLFASLFSDVRVATP
jgi:hypothetical protein